MSGPYRYSYDEPEGVVYVDITPAYRETAVTTGKLATELPTLRVSTYGDSYADCRYLTMRGRRYSVEELFADNGHRWVPVPNAYQKGLRNECGLPVNDRTQRGVYRQLQDLVYRVRDRFAAEHPEWRQVSLRLGVEADLARAEDKAARLAAELEAARARVAELRTDNRRIG